jgi:hypothetical protein
VDVLRPVSRLGPISPPGRAGEAKRDGENGRLEGEAAMLKITFCMRRLPHLTREEFQNYYCKVHTRVLDPEGVAALGMKRYVQLHAYPEEECAELDMGRGCEPSFDAVAEIWLEDHDAFERNWKGPAGMEALKKLLEDERNFVDWSRSVIFMSKELVLMDGPSTPARSPRKSQVSAPPT